MKFAKFTAAVLAATLMAVGCVDESLTFDNQESELPVGAEKGYLSISNLTIDCRIEEGSPEVGVEKPKGTTSRAGESTHEVNVNDFVCSIINESGEVVKSFKYGERPTGNIELLTGDYIFKIASDEVSGAAWESPVYGAEKPFKIVRNQVEPISEIVCSLMQIMVSVSYAPNLLERLGAETLTIVSVGENSLEYALTEKRAGFFAATGTNNTINLRICGTYAADKENFKIIEMNKEVSGVKVGQHRKVHFFVENESSGNISIGATIRDWVTDEVVTCDVKDLLKEEEWKEEGENGSEGGNEGGSNEGQAPSADAPSIVWDGHDISQRVPITSGLSVDLLISAPKGIKEFFVKIESASLTPEELAGVGLCDVLDLCYPTKSYDSNNPGTYIDVEEPLRGLGFAVGEDVVNKTFVKLSITQFMGVLQGVSGTSLKNHDFVLTVVDNEGNTCVKTLMLQTGK